jgi:hypothetical protein
MYLVSFPLLFFPVKDSVELTGTSKDLAIGISLFFTITGSGETFGEPEGEGVGVCDVPGEATGMTFPESHFRIVFPLLFPLMQVYSFPLKVVFWPRKRHLAVGVGLAKAVDAIDARAEMTPKPRIRLEIGFIG